MSPKIDALSYDLGPGITAFSTRRATTPDMADDPYAGFSICHYVDDNPDHTAMCTAMLRTHLQGAALVTPRQRHTSNVAVIDSVADSAPDNVDALVTRLPGVALCISTADCVPVLMADTEAGVIAAAHAGWRGVVSSIVPLTVKVMIAQGAENTRLRVAIGPCICTDCFEVGQQVAQLFRQVGLGESIYSSYGIKPHISLVEAVVSQLSDSGVPADNIIYSHQCTRCHPDKWFSARCLGIQSGRVLSSVCRAQKHQ